MDETGDLFAVLDVEQGQCLGIEAVPIGDPAGAVTQRIGGVFDVHADSTGGQFLFPHRHLVTVNGRGDDKDSQRRIGQLGQYRLALDRIG